MIEKRFKEIVSTQKVVDTVTNKEYDCLLDNDLFDLINEIAEDNERLKEEIKDLNDVLARYEEKELKE